MSLFGTSPAHPGLQARTKSSQSGLFDDEPTPAAQKTSAGIFADDLTGDADSPWAMPTPKKAARAQLVKNLLAADEIPELYVDVYDKLLAEDAGVGSNVSLARVKELLGSTGLEPFVQERIVGVVLGGHAGTGGLGRGEVNVLLALVGLAQEGEDVTLDSVDERRKKLPIPSLGSFDTSKAAPAEQNATSEQPSALSTPSRNTTQNASTPSRQRSTRKQSFGFPEADPWGSPELHAGHSHANNSAYTNGVSSDIEPRRTTSALTTNSGPQDPNDSGAPDLNRTASGGGGVTGGWGGFNGSQGSGFNEHDSSIGGGGFSSSSGGDGGAGDGNSDPTGLGRALSGSHIGRSSGVDEIITVTSIPEKEGMFLFQHRNYEVKSVRRNSKVIRRYSDFVWLLDCLHKRYPFRQLPLLPPKRVAINGNYIAADNSFVEKRRRGLARFANTLVRHPVLSQEQLVIMFLTVPTELAVWRKQATISVQEEFVGKSLPPHLEDSLPPNLEELLETVRSGVRRSAEVYINLSNLLERLAKRSEGVAADYGRFSMGLRAVAEASKDTYMLDTNDVPLLNEGLNAVGKHMSSAQSLLEDEGKAWEEGVLEDMKRQRDCLVSIRDMFDRRDRYDRNNIPQLEKRIENNEQKLRAIREKPADLVKPGEAEKVEDAILRDKQSIVNQHARGVFIKECLLDELKYFQNSQYYVSRLHQDWGQERVKYAELMAENWRALAEEVEVMPAEGS